MNKKYAEEVILELKTALQKSTNDSDLYDAVSKADILFGDEIPKIKDCLNEVIDFNGTLNRNAKNIIALLERQLDEQVMLSYNLKDFEIDDYGFCGLIKQAFEFYENSKIDMATEKVWDAFERIKTYFNPYDKKNSANKLIDMMSMENDECKNLLQEEFKTLTEIGNQYKIRHHETNKIAITNSVHYDYLFHRCISVLRLAVTAINEVNRK